MLWAGTSWGQMTINFDDSNKWIQDGSTSFGSYGNHSYSDGVFTAQLTNGLRNTTAVQDGYVGALGTFSIRLKNDASKVVFTISSGGVADFNFKVRRWDGSPAPQYTVKYSIDNGTNWINLSDIDETLLSTSDWFTYSSPTINSAVSNFKIEISNKEISNTYGERIMIDDFTWTGFASTPTVTISNTGTPVASDIIQGANDVVLFGFSLTPSASVDFSAVNITTSGTATTSDLSNFEIVYDADSDGVYDSGESIVSNQLALGNPLSFTITGQTGFSTERRYLLIADVAAGATVGRTFTASIAAASDVTTTGDENGTAAGNEQTIISATAPVITVTGTLTSFGNVAKDSYSASQSYTVAGSNLTGNITITAPTGFAVSTDDATFASSVVLTQNSGSVSSTTIYVRFSPSTDDGAKTGTITHESPGATTQNLAVEGFAIAIEPTTAASTLNFASVTENSFTINWTRGNGDSVLVIMKSGSAVDSDPLDGTVYTADASFGSGTQIGTGNYVVYKGTGNSVTVTGLTAATTYYVEVFEFSVGSATGTQNYNVTSTLTGSQATLTPPPGLQISSTNTDFVIDFESTVSGVNNGTFTAAGFAPNPTSGQLDSDAWSVTGMSDGLLAFGDTKTSADFSGGTSNGGVTTAGIYAFNTGSNTILGFQPTGSDWTPGTVILRIQNQTGSSISRLNISYVIWVLNNEERSSNFNLSYSYDNSSYFNVSELDFTTTEAAVESATWTSYSKSATIYSLDIPNQAYFYLRWSSNDVGGSGARDEFGIDDITINVNSTNNKRNITGNAGWRMLSSPKSGFTVSDISDNTAIQGITGGPNESYGANFYYYGSSGDWTKPTDMNTAFGDGYGFITYFFNNSTAGSSPLPLTLDVTGTEPSSDVTVTLNKSTVFNSNYYTLVGNPYASNFSLSSITNNGDGIGTNVVIWDNSAGLYGDYQNMSVGSGVVAPWQGFWVSVPSAGTATSITLPKSGKTTSASTAAYFKTTASQEIEGQFILQYTDKLSAPFKVRMLEGASVANDINDLAKFTSLSSVYATVAGRLESASSLNAIEALPLELTEAVTLVVEPLIAGVSGEFQLNWKQFDTFPEYVKLDLIDTETELVYNLREAGSISFTYAAKAAPGDAPLKSVTVTTTGNNRFKVVITPITTSVEAGELIPSQLSLSQNFPNPFNPSTKIAFSLPSQTQVRLAVFDMLGREVAVLVSGVRAVGSYEVTFDAANLASGMYLYRLEANGAVLTQKMTLIK